MRHRSIEQIWKEYNRLNLNAPDKYEVWAFGDSKKTANELAELVLMGMKTATSSCYSLYKADEVLPYVGLHNIILDGEGRAVAIVKTVAVEVVSFAKVTEEHAYLEGEGDRTLAYWRKVHEAFFTREMAEENQAFHTNIPVLCERFRVVYS